MTSRTLGEEGQQLSPKSQPASPPASLGRWRPRSSCPGVTPLPPPKKNNAHRQPCPIPTSDQDPAAVIWVCCRIGFTFVAVFRGARRGEGALRLLEEGGREGPLRALALPALPVLGDSGSLCVRMAPNVHFVCFPEHRKGEDNNNNEKKKEKEKERKERRRGVEKRGRMGTEPLQYSPYAQPGERRAARMTVPVGRPRRPRAGQRRSVSGALAERRRVWSRIPPEQRRGRLVSARVL